MVRRAQGKGGHRVAIMLSWISREFLRAGGRHRGYPMLTCLLTDYVYPKLCAQSRNFSSDSILYHAISSFSNINARARKKRHFMQFCRLPIKYSGTPLFDGAPSTQCIIFSEFLNTPPVLWTDWTQSKTTNCF